MELEELLQKITELTNAVKENKGTDGLNRDALVADLKSLMDEYNQKLLDAMPQRKGEQSEIPPMQQVKGRYASVAKSFENHGEAKINGTKVMPVDLYLAKLLMERAVEQKHPGAKAPSDDLVQMVKAMTSTGAGTGAELVPENLAGEIWEDMYAASRVFADLPEMPMTSDPQDISLLGNMSFAKGTQNTAATAQDIATAENKLTTTELLAEVNWSYNLDEDAVIAMMPALRLEAARAGAEYMDAFALNADATNAAIGNINLDDADPDDDSYFLSAGQDGLRHLFLVDNTNQGSNVNAALDDTKMAAILAKLGKYALDYANVRIVPDVQTYLSMLGMTNVATVDKYGPQAVMVAGELAKYRGIPVIPSGVMPLTEADGKVSTTGSNNTKGQLVAYNRLMWRRGSRRGLTIEIDRSIQKRQMIIVVSFRIAVGCRGTRSTAKHTAGGYNITV
jgi:HK97 family phage major capsid protein